jgi:hypothetical protein
MSRSTTNWPLRHGLPRQPRVRLQAGAEQRRSSSADCDLRGDGMRQEERHRLGEAVRADVQHGDEVARLGDGEHRLGREDVEPRAQGARVGDRHEPAHALARPAQAPDAVLLPDERRSQHVVDPAVEDHHLAAVDELPVDDAGQVRARRADEVPPRFQQEARVPGDGVDGPGCGELRQAPAVGDEIERFLVRLIAATTCFWGRAADLSGLGRTDSSRRCWLLSAVRALWHAASGARMAVAFRQTL